MHISSDAARPSESRGTVTPERQQQVGRWNDMPTVTASSDCTEFLNPSMHSGNYMYHCFNIQ